MSNVTPMAQFFIREGYDSPRNTLNGNMKLQKLLYFSQLVHLAKHGEPLFEEEIRAFVHGSVIEEVRQPYQHQHSNFITNAYYGEVEPKPLTEDQLETLELVKNVFGDLDAQELSDLNHFHESWKEAYERSTTSTGYYNKDLSIISLEEMRTNELDNIREIIEAYEDESKPSYFEEINGYKFYYDPNALELNTDLRELLKCFEGPDVAYTIYKDENERVVIY